MHRSSSLMRIVLGPNDFTIIVLDTYTGDCEMRGNIVSSILSYLGADNSCTESRFAEFCYCLQQLAVCLSIKYFGILELHLGHRS